MKIAIKRPGEKLEIVDAADHLKYRSDVARYFLSDKKGHTYEDTMISLTFVKMPNPKGPNEKYNHMTAGDFTFSFAVDEEGIYKNLPTNFYVYNEIVGNYPIYGSAIFMRCKYYNVWDMPEIWDFECCDLTNEDIDYIKELVQKGE